MITYTVEIKGGPGSARFPKGTAEENKKAAHEKLENTPPDVSMAGQPRIGSVAYQSLFPAIREAPPYTDEDAKKKMGTQIHSITGLVATQTGGKKSTVARFIDNPNLAYHSDEGDAKPLIIRKGGTDYLHDGHHRIVANKLLGNEELSIHFINLDE